MIIYNSNTLTYILFSIFLCKKASFTATYIIHAIIQIIVIILENEMHNKCIQFIITYLL